MLLRCAPMDHQVWSLLAGGTARRTSRKPAPKLEPGTVQLAGTTKGKQGPSVPWHAAPQCQGVQGVRCHIIQGLSLGYGE